MSISSIAELLREHVGHKTTLVEHSGRLHVKCVSCHGRLVDLSSTLRRAETAGTTQLPLAIDDPNACPEHPGEPALTCGRCRSELLGTDTPTLSLIQTGTDPSQHPDWQAARARFPRRP